jgi:hypothetical protein
MKLVREFKCDLTGDDCVIVLNFFDEEICLKKSEYQELIDYIAYEARQFEIEVG